MTTTRNRSEGFLDSNQIEVYTTFSDNRAPELWKSTVTSNYKDMTDTVTPNYRQRVKSGEIINNSCHLSEYDHQPSQGSMTVYQKNSDFNYTHAGSWVEHEMKSYSVGFLEHAGSASAERAKLLALANMDSTPYQFGEDIGELRETIEFLKRPMNSLYRLSLNFKKDVDKYRRRRKSPSRLSSRKDIRKTRSWHRSGDIAKVYLEYQFALSPLVRTVHSAIEAYSYKVPSFPPRLTSRGFDKASDHVSDTVISGTRIFDRVTTVETKQSASILYEVSNPVRDMQWRLGLRAKDVPTTMWQLVPLSFMVDRLVDISSFSKAIINLSDPRIKILAASTALRRKTELSVVFSKGYNSSWTFSVNLTPAKVSRGSYVRTVWHPSVADTIPGFTPANLVSSATKIADLAALTRANFR